MPIIRYELDGDTVKIETAAGRTVEVRSALELLDELRKIDADPGEPEGRTEPGPRRNGGGGPDWRDFQAKLASQVEHSASERHGPVLGSIFGQIVRNPEGAVDMLRGLSKGHRTIRARRKAGTR